MSVRVPNRGKEITYKELQPLGLSMSLLTILSVGHL